MQPREYTLYGLKRPDEDTIRYIGITCRSLSRRLSRHCSDSGYNPHKDRWISKMSPLKPEIIPYAVELTYEEACDLEVFVIKELRSLGFDLLNISEGGDGFSPEDRKRISEKLTGRIQSEETKKKRAEKLRGKKRSPETCLKISERKTGNPLSEPHRLSLCGKRGRHSKLRSKEHCEKISKWMSGRTPSQESREKMSLSHLGQTRVFSEEHCKKLSEAAKRRETKKKEKNGNS